LTDSGGVAWYPLKGSQTAALTCPCSHILYEGTRGRGSSEVQLAYFRRFVGLGYGSYWRGIIFDRHYKDLDDLIAKSKRLYPKLCGPGVHFCESKADYKWVWDTGEELLFRALEKPADYWSYHGQEFPFIGHNEICKHVTSEPYDLMMSCNRSGFVPSEHSPDKERPLPEIPLVVFSTANPWGPGHNWVKRRFIDCAKDREVVRVTTKVFNPRTQEDQDITKTQVRIFGSYRENRFLSPEYVADLERITDPNRRKAWLDGCWDIASGGALDDLWGEHLLLPRFKVPAGWRVDRSFDWGSSKPFSVGWWAEANGEEAKLPDGSTFCPRPGSLIRIAEWYGCTEIGRNQGLRLSAKSVAEGILNRERALFGEGWIKGKVNPGPADNSIGNTIESDEKSIAKKMEESGVRWTESDKRAGSRKQGLQLIRDRMTESRTKEGPGIYVMRNCDASLALIQHIPRSEKDPDDVDTDAEDHIFDDWRYRVLATPEPTPTRIRFAFPS
jgi:hypothetical protein